MAKKEHDMEDASPDILEDATDEDGHVHDKAMDSMEDIGTIEFWNLSVDNVIRYHFAYISLAWESYKLYAKTRGFSARKSKTHKSRKVFVMKQTFICFHEGYRAEKFYNMEN